MFHYVVWVNHVAPGLGHLLAAHEQESVAEHRVGDRQACGHEHGRPNHAMETRDVFAHEVVLHRPTALEFAFTLGIGIAVAREIRQQCIGPYVAHVALVEGQRNAPVERGAADGEVLQAAFRMHTMENIW